MNSLIRELYFFLLRLYQKSLVSPLVTFLHYVTILFENERTMAQKVVRTNPLDNVFASATENRTTSLQVNKYPQVNKHLQVNKYPRIYLKASDRGWPSSRDVSKSSRPNL